MNINRITIIGGGNLGMSIAKGLLKLKVYNNQNIVITEKRPTRISYLQQEGFNVIDSDNPKAIQGSDMVIVSVKPQQVYEVLDEIKSGIISNKQIVVSTVTGINLSEL